MDILIDALYFNLMLCIANALFAGAFLAMWYEFRRHRRILDNERQVYDTGIKAINDTQDKIADLEQSVSNVQMYVQSVKPQDKRSVTHGIYS